MKKKELEDEVIKYDYQTRNTIESNVTHPDAHTTMLNK